MNHSTSRLNSSVKPGPFVSSARLALSTAMGGCSEKAPWPMKTAPVTLPATGVRKLKVPEWKVKVPASRVSTNSFTVAVSPLRPAVRNCW